jgi:hypothetical protein
MTDEVQAAEEAAPEVVQTEAEQVTAPEAAESTEGQVETQPAEDKGEQPEAEDKISASKARRERRKAQDARIKEERAQVEAENARLREQIDRLKGAEKTPPPKIEDYDDHDEYVAALSAHKAAELMDQRQVAALESEAEQREKRKQALQQQQMMEARQNWAAQVEEAQSRYADFQAVVTAPDVPITKDMADLLALSDVGADMAYHLGTNKQQAAQLAQMPAAELVGAMQMLENFVSANAPRPRTQSKAPEPISPVKGKATAMKAIEEMSVAEYRAAREAGKI